MTRLRPYLAAPLLALLIGSPVRASEPAPAPKAAPQGQPAHPAQPIAPVRAPEPAAPKGAAAPVATPTDPLELLRLRLTARLQAGKVSEAAGPNNLHVPVRTAVATGAAKPVSLTTHGHATPARRALAKPAETHAPHWDYKGAGGPAAWGGLKPEFALCGTGQRQSPIDIRGGLAVDLEPVRFDYQASKFAVLDNGHTVQVNLAPGNSIDVGGKRFELKQFHFHRPSEERIDGRQFEMSLHLVHQDESGKLAVVALLFDKGPPHPVLQKVWNNLPLERGEEAQARVPLELEQLLPTDRRYYTYMGSLTTPPCSEGVQWIVMRTPVALTEDQIDIFARIYPMNARPLQSAAGRRIMQSN